jgi:3-keto-5-aminohexanoate cleavage enzyme
MLLINVALTGMIPTKADNPNLPVTAAEIAADILRCHNAGATVFHIHARDENGLPTWKKEIYQQIITATRELIPNAIICGSTSGRLWSDFEWRAEVLDTDIQLASLTPGSFNFPTGPSVNSPEAIKELARKMKDKGIKPEIEIFDRGMLDYSHYLIERGILPWPPYYNFFLGSLGTLAAEPQHLTALTTGLGPDTLWSATGVGRFQFRVNCWAIAMGGHVRVGLEDSIWMDQNKKDPASKVRQVERVVRVSRAMGREPTTPAEARLLLWNN